jgi:2-polyprenyl-6-hydroxyphenyl methylase/3-demethylubiquinone-9 3-methyltransferase
MAKKAAASTINAREIRKFEAMAHAWWDPTGNFKPLHQLNPARIRYIRDSICAARGTNPKKPHPLTGLSVLDIGCGGGLLTEPMARLGARATGIDASEKNIRVASLHAKNMGLVIDYRAMSAEKLAAAGKTFDVVLAMEIVEHVDEVETFLTACAKLTKPGGLLFIATLNRTAKSFLFGIVGAEYVLGWLPKGTHDWKKFLRPSEIADVLEGSNVKTEDVIGVGYQPLTGEFRTVRDTSVNYILKAKKKSAKA